MKRPPAEGYLELSKKYPYLASLEQQISMKKVLICWMLVGISAKGKAQSLAEQYVKTCEQLNGTGQPDSLRKYARMAREAALHEHNTSAKHRAEFFWGNSLMRFKPDSALLLIEGSVRAFGLTNDTKYLTTANGALGNFYAQKGMPNEAMKYYLVAKNFAEQYYSQNETAKYPKIMAAFEHNMATIALETSSYTKAQEYSSKALERARKYQLPEIEWASLSLLGQMAFELKQYGAAENNFAEALQLAQNQQNKLKIGVALNNMGNVYLKQLDDSTTTRKGQLLVKQAQRYYTQALEIAIQLNDYPSASLRLNNLSNVAMHAGDYQRSKRHLEQALQYAQRSKSKTAELKALANLSLNYVKTNEIPLAIQTANRALNLAKETNNSEVVPKLYRTLEEAYLVQKDFGKALAFKQAQMQAKDSLYEVSTSNKLQELQIQYQTEKKERAIERLSAQNAAKEAEISQKNWWLLGVSVLGLLVVGAFVLWYRQRIALEKQRSAEMKQRLLRAQLNPHFLFNSLNSIQRLYVDGKISQANDFIADFAQLMRDILDKTGRTSIPLYEEMEFIEAYLSLEKRRLGDKFDYQIDIDDSLRYSDIEVPAFIVQPLAENALLHGVLPKNQKGKIEVKVKRTRSENVLITVQDDGVGFYHSTTHKAGHTSKGMELIRTRLGKKGRMLIEEIKNLNQEVLGTKIVLELSV